MFPLIDEPYFQFIYADYLEEQGDSLSEILRLFWFIGPPVIRQYAYELHNNYGSNGYGGNGNGYGAHGGLGGHGWYYSLHGDGAYVFSSYR